MTPNERLFQTRYNNLNPQQQEAVDTIDGPVMVIAGPGTGKTEVLAMRIANLLRSDVQVKPYEILCLTFTDEGTVAMRKRLLQIIGIDAMRVHIYTFHAFCNNIIVANTEYFGKQELAPISDLEKIDFVYDILKALPEGHLLRKLKGSLFSDVKPLIKLFDLIKSENWSIKLIELAIDSYLKILPELPKFQYQRNGKNFKKGDPKINEIKKITDQMEQTRAASQLFAEYDKKMQESGCYDFNDMILWVVRAFKEKPEFLQQQQERFQYILADEFQDTSGAQNELLMLLANYWDSPNLFVVGDDDQSIFEFQGARLQNIVDLYKRYEATIKVIVLKENYRSTQLILDASLATIEHNQQRLIDKLIDLKLDKKIVAANERFHTGNFPKPFIRAYYNTLHEEADIVDRIENLYKKGEKLSDIAVLYAQHKQAENIIASLERKKLPYWVKRPVNILKIPLVEQILAIFTYINREISNPFSGEGLLFEMLHAPYWCIPAIDIATLCYYMQKKERKHKYWRFLLLDALLLETLDLSAPKALHKAGKWIENWINKSTVLKLPMLLETICYDSGLTATILQSESSVWDMQVLHTFFDFVKEEATKQRSLKLSSFLEMIDQMREQNIEIPIQKVVRQTDGVRFYTAHSAKGHEFEHVFLIGANTKTWEKKSISGKTFKLPDTITKALQFEEEDQNSVEVARRLFYVAMTRAKTHLSISYALNDNKGKALEASLFIQEIVANCQTENLGLNDESITQFIAQSLAPEPPMNLIMPKRSLIEQRLENFALSASTLNLYLRCPVSFYYDQILRVPEAKSDALSFGIAMHYALEQLFKKMMASSNKVFPSIEEVISFFRYKLYKEESSFTAIQFERSLERGSKALTDYYQNYIHGFPKTVLTEYNIAEASIDGVPIKGKIDKIEFHGSECVVVDYKTGNAVNASKNNLEPPNEAKPNGGDYWRQMVFYALLIQQYPLARNWKMTEGLFDFLEKDDKDNFIRKTVPITKADLTTVTQQIKNAYTAIMNHEFDHGCNDEKCRWCHFTRTYHLDRNIASTASDE
ncbi:MAG: ATP-dependent helicase [Bacteroidetes bacterium]|nr:ATP-dependent helicase [Bacteroidota bacterium]